MKAADGPILELLSFLQLFSPRDCGAQGGDADGTPSLRKLTALYVKQGLSTHDDNLGQIVAKFGRANERQCHHSSGTSMSSGWAELHFTRKCLQMQTCLLKKDFQKQKLLALQRSLMSSEAERAPLRATWTAIFPGDQFCPELTSSNAELQAMWHHLLISV